MRTTVTYDNAGRRNLTVLPDGSCIRSEQDTEDRVVRTTRLLDALATGDAGLSDLRFTYGHAAATATIEEKYVVKRNKRAKPDCSSRH